MNTWLLAAVQPFPLEAGYLAVSISTRWVGPGSKKYFALTFGDRSDQPGRRAEINKILYSILFVTAIDCISGWWSLTRCNEPHTCNQGKQAVQQLRDTNSVFRLHFIFSSLRGLGSGSDMKTELSETGWTRLLLSRTWSDSDGNMWADRNLFLSGRGLKA